MAFNIECAPRNHIAIALLIGLFAHAGSAVAQDRIKQGRALADALCARCHGVGTNDASKLAIAPPMRSLAQRYKAADLAEALAEGIVTAHKDMPEFRLTPDEIDVFLAYFDDLGKRTKAPPVKPAPSK